MGGFGIIEDRPTPEEVYNRRIYFFAMVAYAGRCITGFAAGALTAVIPTFIAETAPPPIRGQLTGFFEISYQAGSLVGFWINYGINQHINPNSVASFRIPLAVQLIPGGLLAVGSLFLRESPALLLRRGKEDQAMENLSYLRMLPKDHHYIQEEVAFVKARMEDELAMSDGRTGVKGYLGGAVKELKVKHMRHRVIIVFFMFMWQNFSGAACINYYSPTLFKAIGISDTALYTGVYGLVKAGPSAGTACHGEIFPSRLRSITGAFSAMSQWLASFISTEAFPHMVASRMGVWGTFLFFSMCCLATFIFTFIWIPETKAIPIECMETLFSGPVRHAAWRQRAVYPPYGFPPVPESLIAHDAELEGKLREAHYEDKQLPT